MKEYEISFNTLLNDMLFHCEKSGFIDEYYMRKLYETISDDTIQDVELSIGERCAYGLNLDVKIYVNNFTAHEPIVEIYRFDGAPIVKEIQHFKEMMPYEKFRRIIG